MASPQPLLADSSPEAVGTKPKSAISRHRRVHKEVGLITGITFIDHPNKNERGVVVSMLKADGACSRSGVRVGDHVTKINGERPANAAHSVKLCDAAWIAEADGSDKNKDRLKFSLHLRTQDFVIGKSYAIEAPEVAAFEGLSVNAMVGVEAMGGKKSSLLPGNKKVDDAGLGLEDSPAGYGAVVVSVTPDSPAHIAGLEPGLTIVSVDGTLCTGGTKEVLRMINAARAKKAAATVVCHLKKSKDDDEHV